MSTLDMTAGSLNRADPRRETRLTLEDRDAFAAFYEEHRRAIRTYLARRLGDGAIADDLTSEVFLAALKWRRSFRDRGFGPRPWLYKIASSVLARWLRKHRRTWLALTEDVAEQNSVREPHDVADSVRRALARLRERDQTVLALFHLEELSIGEVAAALGCRESAIKMRLHRARAALRTELLLEGIIDDPARPQ